MPQKKLDIDFLVMDDVFGSSSAAAKLYPDHSFKMGKGALETQLIKNSRCDLLRSAIMSTEEAVTIIENKEKKVVTFLGYSSEYADELLLKKTITEQIRNIHPQTTLINAGGTETGIGLVYKVAKEFDFETVGIVSTNAKILSKNVDFVIYIQDDSWGGYDQKTGELTPVSQTIVRCTDAAIALGGGSVAQAEMKALVDAGKDVIYLPFLAKQTKGEK